MNRVVPKPECQICHMLTVKAVYEETAEAKSFVLVPERGEGQPFSYQAGQFLTFHIPHKSGVIARSYSLSSAPCIDPEMTICVKRVANGAGSNWLNDHLIVGARIEATRPRGHFVLRPGNEPLLLIAGGSGITPCISLIKQALVETKRRVKLVYANQNEQSVIYQSTLDMLENRFADQFCCQYWFDDERGLMTPDDIALAGEGWSKAECYICGPEPLMDMVERTLKEQFGVDATILTERFVSPKDDHADLDPQAHGFASVLRLSIDGDEHTVPIASGQTLLEAALVAGIDVPNSCIEGHCGTCMAQLKSGDVSMSSTRALSKRNLENGYVLACQARPTSEALIWLDYDL